MTFRDDREAQKNRIDALEDELETARAEAEKLREERDAALAGGTIAGTKHRFAPGAAVWVEWNGKWWRAHVLSVIAAELWQIHYDGWSSKWDEPVGPERIAPAHRPPPGPVAGGGAGLTIGLVVVFLLLVGVALAVMWGASQRVSDAYEPPVPQPASPAAGYAPIDPSLARVGEPVWVMWDGSWYPGTILRIDSPDSYLVHYDGFSDASDELVTLDRLAERD